MTTISSDRLLERLPVLHRLRDIDEGRPLQTLLRALGRAGRDPPPERRPAVGRLLHRDLPASGSIPYIGDLVANNPLHDAGARQRSTWPRRSTTGGARAPCRCSRSWPATSPAGAPTRSSSSSCSAGPRTSTICGCSPAWPDIRDIDAHGPHRRAVRSGVAHRRRPAAGDCRGLAQHPQHRLLPLPAAELSGSRAWSSPTPGGHEHAVRPQPRVSWLLPTFSTSAASAHRLRCSIGGDERETRRAGDRAVRARPNPTDRIHARSRSARRRSGCVARSTTAQLDRRCRSRRVRRSDHGGSRPAAASPSLSTGSRCRQSGSCARTFRRGRPPPAGSDTVAVDVAHGPSRLRTRRRSRDDRGRVPLRVRGRPRRGSVRPAATRARPPRSSRMGTRHRRRSRARWAVRTDHGRRRRCRPRLDPGRHRRVGRRGPPGRRLSSRSAMTAPTSKTSRSTSPTPHVS